VHRIEVGKNNTIVRQLEKSREERFPDLAAEQQDQLREIQQEKKAEFKKMAEESKKQKAEALKAKEARSYAQIMKQDNMTSNTQMRASADASAAEEFEDDFF
jgi:hypothetical protein